MFGGKTWHALGSRSRHQLMHPSHVLQVLALLEQIEESHARGGLERPIALTSGQRQQLQRIRRVAAVLETTLMRLDGDIMLLGNF